MAFLKRKKKKNMDQAYLFLNFNYSESVGGQDCNKSQGNSLRLWGLKTNQPKLQTFLI